MTLPKLHSANAKMSKSDGKKGDRAERRGVVLKKMKKKGKPEGGTGWGAER